MFRIAGERHSESHEKSKHFRIRVGEIWVTVQEWRSKSPTAHQCGEYLRARRHEQLPRTVR